MTHNMRCITIYPWVTKNYDYHTVDMLNTQVGCPNMFWREVFNFESTQNWLASIDETQLFEALL